MVLAEARTLVVAVVGTGSVAAAAGKAPDRLGTLGVAGQDQLADGSGLDRKWQSLVARQVERE